ncbi:MAG TPA: glutamine synthetase family protein, partial [Chloroflexota bacterium]|nr:glutamine synthetase family protein [Chloroflexota bacterium]
TEHLAATTHLGPVGEIRLVPAMETFQLLPYRPREARVMCEMHTLDGEPWELCPRTFLKRLSARTAAQGFTVQAAFEYEFYLARQLDDGSYVPADDSLCFSSDGMERQADVIGDILDTLDQQHLEPRQYYPELGPAQQELSINHAPLLDAADQQIAVRETVRAVALRHGLIASFAPKPFANQAGSGCHVHLSMWQGDRNAFFDADAALGLSKIGRGFVAGVLEHLPGLLAITCPSVNSYRRLAPNMWSSAYTAWGPDNREAGVRVASPFRGRIEATTNLEIKAVDGSANPYLALGTIVAAGLDGIERDLDPGDPLSSNPHDLSDAERERRRIRRYPETLLEAVSALEGDEVLLAALGAERAHEFIGIRRAEFADLGSVTAEEEIAAHFRRY